MSPALSGKRIGLLTAFASSRGGGVAEAVAGQARLLRTLGAEVEVFALADGAEEATRAALAPGPLHLAPVVGPAQLGYAPEQACQLIEARLDLLHLHGIWMHPSRAGAQWARATARPYLISPHGMLDPWITARGRWKKSLARAGYERASWRSASGFHALTAAEARDIARETGRHDAWIIPNAGPTERSAPTQVRKPEVLYLGRIHPKKNLAALVAGWAKASLPGQARLRIVGWGEDRDVRELRRLLAEAGDPTIEFLGPAFGEAKQRLLEAARFLILPSFSEGLPMVVLEAWAAGTPALASQGCNLPEGYAAGAALDCGTTVESIAAGLERALGLSNAAWLQMAAAARGLAAGPFSAAAIARRWQDAYASLLAGEPTR